MDTCSPIPRFIDDAQEHKEHLETDITQAEVDRKNLLIEVSNIDEELTSKRDELNRIDKFLVELRKDVPETVSEASANADKFIEELKEKQSNG